jgi:ABC-type polysaccharide/polyol phosphate transport system ATPase subunit
MDVIRLDGVSLWRRTQEEFSYDLKKTLLSLLEGRYRKPAKRLILDNLTISIQRGEKVGIIGANGSGKSTLLKVICGILQPTHGNVRVGGTIAPLIELGAGFDTELSVLDNIVLYGVMLGFSEREMRRRSADILDFAELQDYATAPVKSLSSGMVARLGFAIATDIHPDVLILDEVFSVGDESFKTKSKQRIEQFWQDNATILLVSHELDFLRNACERVIWLERGRIRQEGDASTIVKAYLDHVRQQSKQGSIEEFLADSEGLSLAGERFLPTSGKKGSVLLTRLFIMDENQKISPYVEFGKPFYVGIEYQVETAVSKLQLGFYLFDMANRMLLEPASHNSLSKTGAICEVGPHCVYAKIPPILRPGRYAIVNVGAYEEGFGHHYVFTERLLTIDVYLGETNAQEWFGQELVHPMIEWVLDE